MPRSYEAFYQRKRKNLSEFVDTGEVHPDDADAIREVCDAFDEDNVVVTRPTWPNAPSNLTSYRSKGTLANWCYALSRYSRELRLLDATPHDVNTQAQQWLDSGLTKGTIRQYQNSLRIFYRYHDECPTDWADVVVFDTQDTSVEPRDMLTKEEIQQLRDAVDHPRDAAILDLLLYCGMRNTALRTLRIKDVDTDDDVWYFNTDADGLKHIHMPEAPRPLLNASTSVQTWLRYHPSDDPEAYLITAKPNFNKVDPYEPVGDKVISRTTNDLKNEVGLQKPLHPHMLRHNFVSICKRNYDMDDATIKWLIAHAPDSNVMERTYSHLSGADYLQKARVSAGEKEPSSESPFTPDGECERCDAHIPSENATSCWNCGMDFTPNAYDTSKQIEDAMYESRVAADDQLGEDIDDLRALLDNPIVKLLTQEELTDERKAELQQMLSNESHRQ